jgi:hypothetical protein
MNDLDVRLADELIFSARRFGMTISMDDLRLMPREWMDGLVRCLTKRVELRERFDTHFYQSVAEYAKDADLNPELENELWDLLIEVADTRATRN